MNKEKIEQIKAELRRSALEDDFPWEQCDYSAWHFALFQWCNRFEAMKAYEHEHNRIFFLLVAEAL